MSSLRHAVVVTRVAGRLAGKRWRLTRTAYLHQHPICECGRRGCSLPSFTIAHRRPPGDDDALFFAWDNLHALSRERFAGCFTDSRSPELVEHTVATLVG